MPSDVGALDEAYARLHRTGPEFEGWLSNHGPMVVEAMMRRDHGEDIGHWLDVYAQRLEEFPQRSSPVGENWQEALGDPRRIADWADYFRRELGDAPWREVLDLWWPRLLPGVAASATHGVIRVGHAVRALCSDGADEVHVAELGQALAYWAARWQPVPGAAIDEPDRAGDPSTGAGPGGAIERLPRLADQTGGVRQRLDRLGHLSGWSEAIQQPVVPDSAEGVPAWLERLVDTAVSRYLHYGHGNGVMLVHTATAPNAVLRSLAALDRRLWVASARAAWAAVAALTSIYAPPEPADPAELPAVGPDCSEADIFSRAVAHGDEHVIKFADTAIDSHDRDGNGDALVAVMRAIELIEPL